MVATAFWSTLGRMRLGRRQGDASAVRSGPGIGRRRHPRIAGQVLDIDLGIGNGGVGVDPVGQAGTASTGSPARSAAEPPSASPPTGCEDRRPPRASQATPARRQSWMCSMPVGRPASSVTRRQVILRSFISASASTARSPGGDGAGAACHHLAGRHRQKPVHVAAQVAVGHDTDKMALLVGYANHAKALAGHGQQGLAHRPGLVHQRRVAVHQVADLQQLRPQLAAGMEWRGTGRA